MKLSSTAVVREFLKMWSESGTRRTRTPIQLHISYILIAVSIRTVLISCSSDTIRIKCTHKDELYYAHPESGCTKLYRCTSVGQQRDSQDCKPGFVFDFNKQNCTRSQDSCHEPTCVGRSNGSYQDTTHACRRFFTCSGGSMKSVDNCPPKQLFDGEKCVDQELVACDLPAAKAHKVQQSAAALCVRQPDGYHSLDDSCNEYAVCSGGKVKGVKRCPPDYRLHAMEQKCLPRQLVPHCSGDLAADSSYDVLCRGQPNGAIVDSLSTDCSTYVICRNQKFESRQKCINQAVFDGAKCVPNFLYQCPVRDSFKPQQTEMCGSKSDGLHSNPSLGCAAYVVCSKGRLVELKRCSAEQYFDPESRSCAEGPPPSPLRPCWERGLSADCDGKPSGYYSGPTCESYFYCFSGHKTEYNCPVGKLFNGEYCESSLVYKCPHGSDVFCAKRPDAYYTEPTDECRTYHYCARGHKITFFCDEGYVYDSKAKRCVRLSDGQQCHTGSLCYGKSDGYHADLRSNCRRYLFCKNNQKLTELTCRNDNVFNGMKCVSPAKYACPSLYNHQQINCTPLRCAKQCERDGFYPDLHAQCREYYFCIGGEATKLACPAGKRFNGELCVPEDQFNCPVFCDRRHERNGACSHARYIP